MRPTRRTGLAIAVTVLAATPLAACGGSAEPRASGPTTVTVAETQGTPSAFVEFGIKQGFFEQQGLEVNVSPGEGGAANVPKLVSGEVQFAGSNVVSVLQADTKGLPLKMVASGTAGTDNPEHGYQSIMVPGDSDVSSLSDLSGKTVAVNTLDNIDEVLFKAALDESGVDAGNVKLVETPFPQMPVSLQQGEIDAVRIIEPFATQAATDGARFLDGGTAGAVKPGLQIGAYVTTTQYLQKNREAVRSFASGVKATAQAVEANPQEFRNFLITYADTPRDLANELVLPTWNGDVDTDSLELLASLMTEYGITDRKPRVSDITADLGAG